MQRLKVVDANKKKEALDELGKFFIVAKNFTEQTGRQAFMPVCIVDEIWHELIACPDQYTALCEKVLGVKAVLDHIPTKGVGKIEWLSYYEKVFGILPYIWFMGIDGKSDKQSYDLYIETGILYTSWDCTPGIDKTARSPSVVIANVN